MLPPRSEAHGPAGQQSVPSTPSLDAREGDASHPRGEGQSRPWAGPTGKSLRWPLAQARGPRPVTVPAPPSEAVRSRNPAVPERPCPRGRERGLGPCSDFGACDKRGHTQGSEALGPVPPRCGDSPAAQPLTAGCGDTRLTGLGGRDETPAQGLGDSAGGASEALS